MKILFTGASSFTGYWFVKELCATGHEVTATFRQPASEYTDIRKSRVTGLAAACKSIHGVSFGSEQFLDLVREGEFDVLCHHAADVTSADVHQRWDPAQVPSAEGLERGSRTPGQRSDTGPGHQPAGRRDH